METSCQSLIQEQKQQDKPDPPDNLQDDQADGAMQDDLKGQGSSSIHILHLPDSLLLHILARLTFTSVGHMAQVCRRLSQVTWDDLLWRSLFLRYYKLPRSTCLAPGSSSWRSELKRLHYLTPAVLCEARKDHKDEVLHVSFSGDGAMYATCSKDGFVKVWDSTTFPARRLFDMDMERQFSWKFTQFSQFNASCSCLLVSGVYMGPGSTAGEIAVFNILDGFKLQCRVMNKPYDVFGAWYDDRHLLSGTLYWTDAGNSVSAVWLSKASQEVDSVKEAVSLMLYRFENHNSSSIRLIHVAEVDEPAPSPPDTLEVTGSPSSSSTQSHPQADTQSHTQGDAQTDTQAGAQADMQPDTQPHIQAGAQGGAQASAQSSTNSSYLDNLLVKQNLRTRRRRSSSSSESDTEKLTEEQEFDQFMNQYTQGDYFRNPEKYKKRKELAEARAYAEKVQADREFDLKFQEERSKEMSKDLGRWPTDRVSTFGDSSNRVSTAAGVSRGGNQEQLEPSQHPANTNTSSTSQGQESLLRTLPSSSASNAGYHGDVGEPMDYNNCAQFENRSNSNSQHESECVTIATNMPPSSSSTPIAGPSGVCSTSDCDMSERGSKQTKVCDKKDVSSIECRASSSVPSSNIWEPLPDRPEHMDVFDSDTEDEHPLNNSSHAATQTAPPPPRAPSPRSLRGRLRSSAGSSQGQGSGQRSSQRPEVKDKLLIYTWGSETYVPHKVGIKRISHQDLNKDKVRMQVIPDANSANIQVQEFESSDDSDDELPDPAWGAHPHHVPRGPNAARDLPDHTIEMHGHIVGICLSPDHTKVFVNCRPWPPGYIIADPMETPALAQEVEITAYDLRTFERVGPVLTSHKAYTSSEQCFFLNLCVADQYCASGAEDKHAHLWDTHYGNRLYTFPHDSVVNCVATNPADPQMLVTVSDDFTIKRWCSRHRMRQLREAGLVKDDVMTDGLVKDDVMTDAGLVKDDVMTDDLVLD